MQVKQFVARLLTHPQKRRERGHAHLTLWLLILGISLVSLLSLSVQPAQAHSLTTAQQTKAYKPDAYASPAMPKDDCSDGSATCFAGTPDQNSGKVKNPMGDNPLMFFTDPGLTVGQSSVVTLWQGGVAIVDVFVVLLIALNGIRIMVSGSIFRYADVVETIPRILVSLVAAHISLSLIGIILGLNNGLSAAFLGFAQHVSFGTNKLPNDVSFNAIFTDAIKSVLGSAGTGALASGLLAIGAGVLKTFGGPIGSAIGSIMGGASGAAKMGFGVAFAIALLTQLPRIMLQIVALVMTTMLFAQMIVRILLIDFYIVISAPCIACSCLPGRSGQPVTNFWLKGIITTILAQSLQTVGVIVAQILFDSIFALVNNKLPGFFNNNIISDVNLAQLVVYVAMLWFILRLPTIFSLNPSTQMIAAGGQLAASAASSVVGAVGSGASGVVSLGGATLLTR